jgi:hypothetical protein
MPLGSWYSQLPSFGWFDPGDRPRSNALGVPDSQQGIALPTRRGLGKWFLVTPPGGNQPFPLQQTDTGPAPWTGRGVDISAAGAHQMGYTPKNFPTDANFDVKPIDTTGLGLAAGYMGGVPGANDTAVAEGPTQGRKMPGLMDMFQPRDLGGENKPVSFADALAQRSNSLIGLGLGLMSPSWPGQATGIAAGLEGYQRGAGQDAQAAQAAAALRERRAERAQAQANLQITDAQRAMRDVLGPNATPEQKSEFMKNYYASKTDPGAWILKDIIDPNDPEGERKITVQEHNRTGQIRPPSLPGQVGAAAGPPATNWAPGASNAPVYGGGSAGFSATPSGAPPPAAPRGAVTMPNGEVVTPPPGLNQAGRKAWTNHIATTAAKVASGEMTEAQGNSNLFAGKMEIAKSMLDPETEKKGLDPIWNRVERYGGWVGNTLALPNDYKQYQTAKDAFLNAFLRRVSGATVHDAEYYREEKVYFPQPGDDEKRIEYKRQLRDDAIMRMKQQVGPGYRPPPEAPSKKQEGTGGGGGGSSGTVKWGRDANGNPVPLP